MVIPVIFMLYGHCDKAYERVTSLGLYMVSMMIIILMVMLG